jgi:hypothetical protein
MHTRHDPRRKSFHSLAFLLIFLGALASTAAAHPLTQGVLDVTIRPDRIDVRARVTLEEVSVTNMLVAPDPARPPVSGASDEAFRQHAAYLAAHLHFTADGKPLAGRVIDVTPPVHASDVKVASAVYNLEYSFPVSSPRVIALRHDTLADAQYSAGQNWVTSYFVTISQPGRAATQSLLSRNENASFTCDWRGAAPAAAEAGTFGAKCRLFATYGVHGVEHILGQPTGRSIFSRTDVGWDHLLFVTALVLSTKSLWDLLKVVTAFTLAHTITLTLAALKLVAVNERITEPLIALSIVFVAVQNVFWPRQSRGALRLAAAFFFGLFHGLGFAGALLETMQEMHGVTVFLAILGFSIGVELGHQLVVVPLFIGLQTLRRRRPTALSQERHHFKVQRFGSLAISLAGMFYLIVALRMSFSR